MQNKDVPLLGVQQFTQLSFWLMPMNAIRHVRQQQRIATPVCSGPAGPAFEWFSRCALGP